MRKITTILLLFSLSTIVYSQTITGYEYWFDHQYVNKKSVTSNNGNISLSLDVSNLIDGVHFYNFRAKDDKGSWSAPVTHYFLKLTPVASGQLVSYEYWIDKDYENRKSENSSSPVISLDIDVNTLVDGMHYLTIRAKDNKDSWSSPVTHYFYKSKQPDNIENEIIAYEYWFNDANISRTQVTLPVPVNPLDIKDQLFTIENMITKSTPNSFDLKVDVYGNAKIYYSCTNSFNIRFQDSNGNWSTTDISLFTDGKGIEIEADLLTSDLPVTKANPGADEIHFYKLNALKGDSLIWKTNQPCIIQVFDPFGVEVYKASNDDVLSFNGTRVKRDGVYYVLLHSVDSYASQITLDYKHIHKYAVLGYDVKRVGNQGISTINFEGNGFESSTKITLTNSDNTIEIIPDTIICRDLGKLSAVIDFTDKIKGVYDINVIFRDTTVVIENGIEIEESKPIELDVSIIGPADFRIGSSVTYTITVRNNGNATAYQVPLNIKIISDSENTIQNLKLGDNIPRLQMPTDIDLSIFSEEDRNAILKYYNDFQDIYHFLRLYDEETGKYILTNDFFIPVAPNSTFTMTITLTALTSLDIEAIIPNEWRGYQRHNNSSVIRAKNLDMACCIHDSFNCLMGLTSLDPSGIGSAVNCVWNFIDAIFFMPLSISCAMNEDDAASKALSGFNIVASYVNAFASAAMNCGGGFAYLNTFTTSVNCFKAADSWLSGDCFPQPNKDRQHSDGVQSYDPNDKIGYRSPSGSTYFKEDMTNMTYVINFENDPEKATAAAQDVYVTDTLDMTRFDIHSFRAGHIMVGDKLAKAPYDAQNHTWEVDMRPEMNLITRVNLSLDEEKGIAHWHFASIDPKTDEPTTDVFAGFLPPNDETGRGQGCVSFAIDLKKDLLNDTEISNEAHIVFDYNDPIVTPAWINRKDIIPPVSQMLQPIELNDSIIRLQWQGEDKGSGVWRYTVYAREEQSAWYPLHINTELDNADFKYLCDKHYEFYVIATDNATNMEQKETVAEVGFYKSSLGYSFPATTSAEIQVYPNPVVDGKLIVNIQGFGIQNLKIELYSETGTFITAKQAIMGQNVIDVSYLPNGIYIVKVGDRTATVVKK